MWSRIGDWGEGWAGRIAGDAARCVPPVLALALGLMIDHEPGSGVFTLRWDPATLAFGLLGGLVATCAVSVFRWCTSEGRDGSPRRAFARAVIRVALPATAFPFAMMVDHVPGSGVFNFRWNGEKYAFGILGSFIGACLICFFQWRIWVRSRAQAPD